MHHHMPPSKSGWPSLKVVNFSPFFFLFRAKDLSATSVDRATAGLNYERLIVISYKFKPPTYIQEPLVIGRTGYLQRDLKEKTVSSR
jgi:hypothetical protein